MQRISPWLISFRFTMNNQYDKDDVQGNRSLPKFVYQGNSNSAYLSGSSSMTLHVLEGWDPAGESRSRMMSRGVR